MTFDPTPLLKTFGAAADVAGQIATDKAINGRRQSKGETDADAELQIAAGLAEKSAADAAELAGGVSLQDGQLIEEHNMADTPDGAGTEGRVYHNLGRMPYGGFAIYTSSGSAAILCDVLHEEYVEFNGQSGTYSVWIF